MQAVEIKRLSVHRIGIVAVAIGTLAAGLVGTHALYDATQNSDSGAVIATRNVSRTSPADTSRFIEWNTNLPAVSVESVQSAAEIQFLEMNTILPGQSVAAVRSHAETQFLEMNTLLPEPASPKFEPYTTTRFLEMNTLPGDDALYLPSRTESQPAGTPY